MIELLRRGWDRVSIYLPIMLMALAALGTWQLVRDAPESDARPPPRAARHEPDYFMRDFSVRSFDADGRLQSEIIGKMARHYPDDDTLEIDEARMRSFDAMGRLTHASARRALSNGDASEVQLFGDAVVVREAVTAPGARPEPRMEFRSEFLHTFVNVERVRSHLPVVLTRGTDRFTGDALDYDNLDRVLHLSGKVRGTLAPAPRSDQQGGSRTTGSPG